MGAANETYSVELKLSQFEYLTKMAEKHGLPDESKALRCLVNFAIDADDRESAIFDDIRCFDC